MSIDTTAIKSDRAAIVAELQALGATVSHAGKFKCPLHDDTMPSAYIRESASGWKFHCHPCGHGERGLDVFDLRAKREGRDVADVMRDLAHEHGGEHRAGCDDVDNPPRQSSAGEQRDRRRATDISDIKRMTRHLAEYYTYSDPDTRQADLIVTRIEPPNERKRFSQWSPSPDGGFVNKKPSGLQPLYNRARIRDTGDVVVVEGESCVHALHEVGIIATTSPGGAGKSDLADWTPLAGRAVWLWPDRDMADKSGQRAGIRHMRAVANILETLDPPVRLHWIDCDQLDLPPKGDAADFLAARAHLSVDERRDAVHEVLANAESMGADAKFAAHIEDIIAGRYTAIDWPWPAINNLTEALLPGTVTLLAAKGGATKSFITLEAVMHWFDRGIRCALFAMEEDSEHALKRAVAMRSGEGDYTQTKWINANPDRSRDITAEYAQFESEFSGHITFALDKIITLADLAKWVNEQAQRGCRIIAIDPVTAAEPGGKQWEKDLEFIMSVKTTARQFDCSVILVTHPKKGSAGTSLDDLAGGSAYARFAQTVLFLEPLEKDESYSVRTAFGTNPDARPNRLLHIRKSRNGPGTGLSIAMHFDGATLRTSELGVVVRDK